jgi:hypothetical protein
LYFELAILVGTGGCKKYFSSDKGFLDEAFANERGIEREPCLDGAFERANPGDSFDSQQQRQTGALVALTSSERLYRKLAKRVNGAVTGPGAPAAAPAQKAA